MAITTRYTVQRMKTHAQIFRALLDSVNTTDLDEEVRCLLALSTAVNGRLRVLEAMVRAPSPAWPEAMETEGETVLQGMTPKEWAAAFSELVDLARAASAKKVSN